MHDLWCNPYSEQCRRPYSKLLPSVLDQVANPVNQVLIAKGLGNIYIYIHIVALLGPSLPHSHPEHDELLSKYRNQDSRSNQMCDGIKRIAQIFVSIPCTRV